LESVEE
jgi:hypothetical protein